MTRVSYHFPPAHEKAVRKGRLSQHSTKDESEPERSTSPPMTPELKVTRTFNCCELSHGRFPARSLPNPRRQAPPQQVVAVEDHSHRVRHVLGRRALRVAEARGLAGDRENFALCVAGELARVFALKYGEQARRLHGFKPVHVRTPTRRGRGLCGSSTKAWNAFPTASWGCAHFHFGERGLRSADGMRPVRQRFRALVSRCLRQTQREGVRSWAKETKCGKRKSRSRSRTRRSLRSRVASQ